jgi:hypothetical protein
VTTSSAVYCNTCKANTGVRTCPWEKKRGCRSTKLGAGRAPKPILPYLRRAGSSQPDLNSTRTYVDAANWGRKGERLYVDGTLRVRIVSVLDRRRIQATRISTCKFVARACSDRLCTCSMQELLLASKHKRAQVHSHREARDGDVCCMCMCPFVIGTAVRYMISMLMCVFEPHAPMHVRTKCTSILHKGKQSILNTEFVEVCQSIA